MSRSTALTLIALLLCGGMLLAACGGGEPPAGPTPTPPPPVTLNPPADPVFVAGCAVTDLETWLESTDFLLRDFVSQLNAAQNQTPEQVRVTIRRMADLRDALVAVPAPDGCAGEAHRLILQMLADSLQSLQAYGNGEGVDLRAAQTEVDTLLGGIQTLQQALQAQLDAHFATQQAAN